MDGGPASLPVAACGASTKVRGLTGTTIAAPPTALARERRQAQVTVSGVPGHPRCTVTTTLFGPYPTARRACRRTAADKSSEEVTQTRPGDGVLNSASIASTKRGYYAWQAETSPGDTWLGSRSPCLAANTTTFVP